jgi:LAO/AO transport system kinase
LSQSIKLLAESIRKRDRPSLAKGITLVESSLEDDLPKAETLLTELLPFSGKAIRIGISGAPGVGKSTFIEAFGQTLLTKNQKIAVLTVDPSSPITGGSILGDKTRMEILSRHQDVFIRPTPSGLALGGVARHTREAMILCEAAGYDTILIETVGVGQSEVTVASMVDVFLTLQSPGGGDELQGIKKGILELADIIAITKADGDFKQAANLSRAEHERAVSLVRSGWTPPVLTCSSMTGEGIDNIWDAIENFLRHQKSSSAFKTRRHHQIKQWFESEIDAWLHRRFFAGNEAMLKTWESEAASGKLPANVAARLAIETMIPPKTMATTLAQD